MNYSNQMITTRVLNWWWSRTIGAPAQQRKHEIPYLVSMEKVVTVSWLCPSYFSLIDRTYGLSCEVVA